MIQRSSLIIKYGIAVLMVCLLYGCAFELPNEAHQYAYFGGEIVNPNAKYIVLLSTHKENDTIYLDKNNRFLHRIDSLQEGLYSFKHTPEKQIVLLEKGDSILLRLNTLEFDESLVFTGRGAEKNNFLIDMFLYNEKKRSGLRTIDLKDTPEQFKKEQEIALEKISTRHQQLAKKYQFSPLAYHITKSSFEYGLYARAEIYTRKREKLLTNEGFNAIPATFFSYRKEINYNDTALKKLYAYNRYLRQYINNASRNNDNKEHPYTIVEETKHELCIIDELIKDGYIKNNMFRNTVRKFLLYSESNKDSYAVFEHYKSKKPDTTILKELETLMLATATLKPSKPLPDQELMTISEENTAYISTILKKPITAFYFWSIDNKNHYIKAHRRAASLRLMYPNVDFIAVNRDEDLSHHAWLQLIKRNQYDLTKEYKFKTANCAVDELVIHYKNKVILLDNKGNIIKANAKLFSPRLHEVIKGHQKTQ